jgi:uncharacterized protein YndB with AHSA1/START domain
VPTGERWRSCAPTSAPSGTTVCSSSRWRPKRPRERRSGHDWRTREILIAASPETVFGFLVDPVQMARWISISHTVEAHPGGVFRVEVSRGNVASGVYTEVILHRRVAFTWGWESSASSPRAMAMGIACFLKLTPVDQTTGWVAIARFSRICVAAVVAKLHFVMPLQDPAVSRHPLIRSDEEAQRGRGRERH